MTDAASIFAETTLERFVGGRCAVQKLKVALLNIHKIDMSATAFASNVPIFCGNLSMRIGIYGPSEKRL